MRADDPANVRDQYATGTGLEARASIYGSEGADARDVVVQELRRVRPARLLEVAAALSTHFTSSR